MPWNLDNDRPIYLQIIERISMDIVSGVYRAGDKLPSVRELAASAAVNPNTMQKALVELEELKLVYTKRTNGKFVTIDEKLIEKLKYEYACELSYKYFESMKNIGFTKNETIKYLKDLEGDK